MKLNRRLLAVGAVFASLPFVSAGDITGKITLTGNPPPEKILPLDPNCGRLWEGKEKPTTRFYVVGKSGELADVFVHLKEGVKDKGAGGAGAKPALLDQVGCEYVPYVSGLQTNQKLLVRNSDPLLHNVHPTPTTPGNLEKNLAQLPKGKDLEFTFPKEEVFLRFKCDVHPWMFSYVGVLEHPYFAVTGPDGSFKIANVPPGKYTVEAYHRKAGKSTQEIEVPATGNKEANFKFDVK